MWVRAKISLLLLCLGTNTLLCQDFSSRTWGLSLAPGFSKGKAPNPETYGAPGFVNFKITEPFQSSIHASAFLRKKGKILHHTKHLGVTTYFYKDIFSYDPSTTATTYLWGKRSLIFMEGGYKLGRNIQLGKITMLPEIGVTANYLIHSFYRYEYTWLGTVVKKSQNLTNVLGKFNYGYSSVSSDCLFC